ncbi:CBS domain-containing protein [Desulfurivibrio dismutans]|uniref:CBS domain-containing protein n=1 Tax=Desulfurivibrio dismutans TaxID=1398908 RepID=UPI0023DB63E2|nr:CBS domain-containing protein [Desulfurivibrio alkaliphilus]MDF1614741.1 CBS domain-containing protein [Desulfurivibrio alkaliphilus]
MPAENESLPGCTAPTPWPKPLTLPLPWPTAAKSEINQSKQQKEAGMDIKKYMSTPPVTIPPAMTIPAARSLLQSHHFRHLPVVDEQGKLLGMVTDRDLRSAYPSNILDQDSRQQLAQLQHKPVSEIMSRTTFTLPAAASIDDALLLLDRERIGALPVVDDQHRVLGIFSIRDLMGAYRRLFGLGERGSAMLTIIDDGSPRQLSRLGAALEAADIHFTRLLKIKGQEPEAGEENLIYLRVTTYNLPAVRKVLADAGFKGKNW